MSPLSNIRVYADQLTREALRTDAPRLLLLGGYLGYPNFGDILQLQGAIDWHQRPAPQSAPTSPPLHPFPPREPVVVCDIASLTDPRFIDRLRDRLALRHILFLAHGNAQPPLDGPPLELLDNPAPCRISHLHLYGGGYLNRTWGEHMLACAEYLIERFGVGHYVMSGQQAQPAFEDRIREHIARCRPALVGGRDDESVDVLRRAGAPAEYSFDDAAEEMTRVRDAFLATSRASHSPPPSALVHLNVSPYASDAKDAVDALCDRLVTLLESTAQPGPTKAGTTGHSASNSGGRGGEQPDERAAHRTNAAPPYAVLLNAYNDERVEHVADTLGVVLRMGDRFPLSDFRVVQLAALAFNGAAPTPAMHAASPAADAHSTSPIALVCSYHAAMLCQMLRIPVWLEVRNAYYRQKAAGLGLTRAAGDSRADNDAAFLAFLRERPVVALDAQLRRRADWLGKLRDAYRIAPQERPPIAMPVSHVDAPAPRPSAAEEAAAVEARHRAEIAHFQDSIRQLQSWIEQLENGKVWLTEQRDNYKRLAEQHQHDHASTLAQLRERDEHLASLAQEVELHKARANVAREEQQAALNRIAQLQGGIDWLQPQYASWKARAAELHHYVEELLPLQKRSDEERQRLESRVAELLAELRSIRERPANASNARSTE